MLDHALTHLSSDRPEAISLHDRVQIALAIADTPLLKSLLTHCTPPLTQPHRLGSVKASIGVPFEARRTVDGVVEFEVIHSVLAESPQEIEEHIAATTAPHLVKREYLMLTRCESETHCLGKKLSLAQAITILGTSGFSQEQVDDIINLPAEAWHRSWWYGPDEFGNFTEPFMRMMRTIRFTDGTFELHYKDFFAQNKPTVFTSQEERVLIEIKTEQRSFRKTLDHINLARTQLGITHAILICDEISELETRGFISQGISIYTAQQLALQTRADCSLCANHDCPLNGCEDSGVTMCRRFYLDATPVS
ncbi:hypothetical protein [Leptolyngbya sp. FACHB-8]|uniref:hypothetical protein n=1 Tax=unclassified Leptolyngbya TaxID=2650499 RepID=UPI001684321B|nr:hypothetical protein [Leptolyngbya sp. FACHB-8]MBD1910372.1 hypothetical protein [Leptolyngbya sp. FACHB-8]